MRRVLALLSFAALAVASTGCSGEDAEEARALLTQSQAALADVRSATFTMKLSMEGAPQDFSFTISGGAYVKGKRAGDFYAVMGTDSGLFQDIVVMQQDGRVAASMDGRVVTDGLPPAQTQNPVGMMPLDPYVKDVKVEHDKLIGGEPATKITCVVDTKKLLDNSLGSLSQVNGFGEAGFDLGDMFGDTRAVFYLSDTTHLPLRALVDVPMDLLGEEVVMHVDFAYTSFDEKLRFPSLR
jgi:hypothetical protein